MKKAAKGLAFPIRKILENALPLEHAKPSLKVDDEVKAKNEANQEVGEDLMVRGEDTKHLSTIRTATTSNSHVIRMSLILLYREIPTSWVMKMLERRRVW